jgi:hypothetical protein
MRVFDTAVAALSTTLDVYEVILSEHIFLAGDMRAFFTPMYPPSDWRMTLPLCRNSPAVDLSHLMHAHVFAHCTDIMTKKGRPNVARYVSLFPASHLFTFL